jgi:hypothetical protein
MIVGIVKPGGETALRGVEKIYPMIIISCRTSPRNQDLSTWKRGGRVKETVGTVGECFIGVQIPTQSH